MSTTRMQRGMDGSQIYMSSCVSVPGTPDLIFQSYVWCPRNYPGELFFICQYIFEYNDEKAEVVEE